MCVNKKRDFINFYRILNMLSYKQIQFEDISTDIDCKPLLVMYILLQNIWQTEQYDKRSKLSFDYLIKVTNRLFNKTIQNIQNWICGLSEEIGIAAIYFFI